MGSMNIDRKYIDSGLITERFHPSEPYVIYNYTPECQFSRSWDEVTMQCRGLILHKDTGEVIARPFTKFFNYEEHIAGGLPIPEGIPQVFDKRDGSLGILYWGVNGDPYIATRGSFVSDQALWATAFFRDHQHHIEFNRNYTYLFEIIYPENRIVVDYGRYEGLDLLAIVNTQTGEELVVMPVATPLGKPVQYGTFTSYEELKALNEKNKEGFILRYPNGLRLKIKFEDYVRLHKVMTGLSEIGLWEMLASGKNVLDIFEEIPDEMHDWVKDVVKKLSHQFLEIETAARDVYKLVIFLVTRKEQAEVISKSKYPGVTFAMLDGKDYRQAIWKMVRPHGSHTFRKDIDL